MNYPSTSLCLHLTAKHCSKSRTTLTSILSFHITQTLLLTLLNALSKPSLSLKFSTCIASTIGSKKATKQTL
ncbi:hypothetical protein LguiB_003498 [Lonicera macranthoides]